MKIACPICKEKVNPKDIKNTHKNSIYVEKQCPHCDGWFSLNKAQTIIKILGILLLLSTSLLNILNIKTEYNLVFSSIGLVGIAIAVLITFFGKHDKVV